MQFQKQRLMNLYREGVTISVSFADLGVVLIWPEPRKIVDFLDPYMDFRKRLNDSIFALVKDFCYCPLLLFHLHKSVAYLQNWAKRITNFMFQSNV